MRYVLLSRGKPAAVFPKAASVWVTQTECSSTTDHPFKFLSFFFWLSSLNLSIYQNCREKRKRRRRRRRGEEERRSVEQNTPTPLSHLLTAQLSLSLTAAGWFISAWVCVCMCACVCSYLVHVHTYEIVLVMLHSCVQTWQCYSGWPWLFFHYR